MYKDMIPKALYIHIPFCVKKCRYCDFNSMVSESNIVDNYLMAIDKELSALNGKYTFSTVYIGGGTPSVLTENQLERLLCSVARSIPINEIQEYTIEVNPGTVKENKVRLLKESLVNRISLGVQSFQDRQLTFLGRIHVSDDARKAFALLRMNGFDNINIDLIFGCPGQTLEDWENDLKTAVGLYPAHISTYSLTYEEGTPLTSDLVSGVIGRLDESIELEMYKAAISYLTQNGYKHYEISNFAKDGCECSHNYFYWKNMGYVGIGAGAYSYIGGIRTSNEKDVLKYIEGLGTDKNTQSFAEYLLPDKCASETVIMSLRLRQGIANSDFYERFGYKLEDQFGEQIKKLMRDKLISYDDEGLRLTEKGLFVADTVLTEFV